MMISDSVPSYMRITRAISARTFWQPPFSRHTIRRFFDPCESTKFQPPAPSTGFSITSRLSTNRPAVLTSLKAITFRLLVQAFARMIRGVANQRHRVSVFLAILALGLGGGSLPAIPAEAPPDYRYQIEVLA